MTTIIYFIFAVIAGCLVIAKSVIWFIERKWGKHYRVKFKDYNGNPAVIHVWTKDDLYALIIQETHNLLAKDIQQD
jgi:hypothetical protein